MSRPRRRIEEIVELHKRVGSRAQEVFVEGSTDKRFIEKFLDRHKLGYVAVLEIDSVEVPTDQVIALGLSDGKRGRVITLAALLEGLVAINHVVCVADADTDLFFGRQHQYSLLIKTDGTAMEIYGFDTRVIAAIISVSLAGFPKRAERIIQELSSALIPSFLIRIANEELALSGTFPTLHDFCSYDRKRDELVFREGDYIRSVFRNYLQPTFQDIENRLSDLRGRAGVNHKHCSHGHDFVGVFCWYVRQHAQFGHLHAQTMATLFMSLVDSSHLDEEPMFIELRRRLAGPVIKSGPNTLLLV